MSASNTANRIDTAIRNLFSGAVIAIDIDDSFEVEIKERAAIEEMSANEQKALIVVNVSFQKEGFVYSTEFCFVDASGGIGEGVFYNPENDSCSTSELAAAAGLSIDEVDVDEVRDTLSYLIPGLAQKGVNEAFDKFVLRVI